ncbi:MAG: SURF1 family protein [Castellaniella sp.]|uniref:SURF1 family protein n=2 Tax=Castellaniella sp. TaxID=1955812 RepID=UPI003C77D98D
MPQRSSRPLPTGWLVLWTVLLAAALGGFVALGTWQVHRMHWKHALIARVDGLLRAPPVSAPGPDTWAGLRADRDEYRRVELRGVLLDREILVQANTRLGAGFWVMTPLRRDDGSSVFVNRGFVDAAHRDPARRGAAPPAGPVRIEGLLRLSQLGGGFLRDNAPAEGRWYSRDVAAMARSLGLSSVAPYFIDQSADDGAAADTARPARWPVPGLTVVHFRDEHLSYALTWYALAAMTAAAMAYGARQEWRRRRAARR